MGTSTRYVGGKVVKGTMVSGLPVTTSVFTSSEVESIIGATSLWKATNTNLGKFIRTGSGEELKKFFNRIFLAVGGKRYIMEVLFPGISVLYEIIKAIENIKFIHDVFVLSIFNEELTAKNLTSLLLDVASRIEITGGTKYDAISRNAVVQLLDYLSGRYEKVDGKAFLSSFSVRDSVRYFATRHVYSLVMNFVENKLEEQLSIPTKDLLARREIIYEYIESEVNSIEMSEDLSFEDIETLYNEIISSESDQEGDKHGD